MAVVLNTFAEWWEASGRRRRFSSRITFVVEREFIERQVPAADPRLCRILQRYLEHALADVPWEDKMVASVRRAIAEMMREGDPTIAWVAKNWD
jgi:hypothetical protein